MTTANLPEEPRADCEVTAHDAGAIGHRRAPTPMIPGPGSLREEDLRVLGSEIVPHYGRAWVAQHTRALGLLQDVLGARFPPYLIPGTGTTCLEAAILNFFRPGERVAVPDTGYFGRRLAAIARAHGLHVHEIPVALGQPVDPGQVAEVAADVRGILTVHVESATGVRHPIEAIADVAAQTDTLVVVDGVASAGGEDLHLAHAGIDVFVTASQKGLEGPPGLGVIALGDRARRRLDQRRWQTPSWYLDLGNWDQHRTENAAWEPHPVTMPTNLVLALSASLGRIHAAGIGNWVNLRRRLAQRLRAGLIDLGLSPIAAPDCQSHLVVAAWTADAGSLVDAVLASDNIAITTGLEPQRDNAIRIGLLGRTASPYWVDRLLGAIRSSAARLG